jgi:hypothetical protein
LLSTCLIGKVCGETSLTSYQQAFRPAQTSF